MYSCNISEFDSEVTAVCLKIWTFFWIGYQLFCLVSILLFHLFASENSHSHHAYILITVSMLNSPRQFPVGTAINNLRTCTRSSARLVCDIHVRVMRDLKTEPNFSFWLESISFNMYSRSTLLSLLKENTATSHSNCHSLRFPFFRIKCDYVSSLSIHDTCPLKLIFNKTEIMPRLKAVTFKTT